LLFRYCFGNKLMLYSDFGITKWIHFIIWRQIEKKIIHFKRNIYRYSFMSQSWVSPYFFVEDHWVRVCICSFVIKCIKLSRKNIPKNSNSDVSSNTSSKTPDLDVNIWGSDPGFSFSYCDWTDLIVSFFLHL